MFFGLFNRKSSEETPEQPIYLPNEQAQQQLVALVQKVDIISKKMGLSVQRARVALVLDISTSMSALFSQGTIQRLCERVLALGVKFDDNQAVDIFLFGIYDYELGELRPQNFYGFVEREIIHKYPLEKGTQYSLVIKRIIQKYTSQPGDPAYIMFVTDGDNSDRTATEKAIVTASTYPIFWQFIGLGHTQGFRFLQKLDLIDGRLIDNANFFAVDDIDQISDEELYLRMLREFPIWLQLAQDKGLY